MQAFELELTNEEYHKHPAFSKSGLCEILFKSGYHYEAKYIKGIRQKEKPAFVFGTALHARLFEPKEYVKDYAVGPEGKTKSSKEWKAFADAEENKDKILLKAEEAEEIERITQRVLEMPSVQGFFDGTGFAERSFFMQMNTPYGAVTLKARPDFLYIRDGKVCIIDLKSTRDASVIGFAKECAKYHYDIQAALYADIIAANFPHLQVDSFTFIAAEKEEPFACAAYTLSTADEDLINGRLSYMKAVHLAAKQKYENAYQPYSGYRERQPLKMPKWNKAPAVRLGDAVHCYIQGQIKESYSDPERFISWLCTLAAATPDQARELILENYPNIAAIQQAYAGDPDVMDVINQINQKLHNKGAI